MNGTISRRGFGGIMAGTLGALLATRLPASAAMTPGSNGQRALRADSLTSPYALPDLPYGYDALEPSIDTLTMQIHHDKHHKAYVDNLKQSAGRLSRNPEVGCPDDHDRLHRRPRGDRCTVRNNLGGHLNHWGFWLIMSPSTGAPSPELAAAINTKFGSLDAMKAAVNEAGVKRFGSGWTWLVVKNGALDVLSTPNQDNPISDGSGTPIIGIDVWEHAYYLKYQNKRADYLAAWWNVVNWEMASQGYSAALK
jgi:superoxide dismutase, Fe-Mn family